MQLSAIIIAAMLSVTLTSCHDADLLQSNTKPDSENSVSSQAPSVSQIPELLSESKSLKPPVAQCDVNNVKLSIFTTDDSSFEYYNCKEDDDFYILEYLKHANQNIFIYKKIDDGGNNYPKVEAVSIYKPTDETKAPIMIVLHGQYSCCYPTPSGTLYTVKLYKIINNDNDIQVIDYTSMLGEDDYGKDYGFDGQNDVREKITYQFKNISSIKKWLKNNY